MTDKELIKAVLNWVQDPNDEQTNEEFFMMARLVRIGAAVMPRPIEEAREEEYPLLWFWWPDFEEWGHGGFIEQISGEPRVWYRHGHPAPCAPTHFFREDALPKPKETE